MFPLGEDNVVIYDPMNKVGKKLGVKSILDIAPTSLKILGIEVPNDMEGNIIEFQKR